MGYTDRIRCVHGRILAVTLAPLGLGTATPQSCPPSYTQSLVYVHISFSRPLLEHIIVTDKTQRIRMHEIFSTVAYSIIVLAGILGRAVEPRTCL